MCHELKINYGGMSSFVDYRFRTKTGGGMRFVIYALHGGPKAKARYDYGQIAIADMIAHGHTHELDDNVQVPFKLDEAGDISKKKIYSVS
jgi:hypothetical protein